MHNSEYTNTHWIAYFDVVNFMVCELYIDFFFFKDKVKIQVWWKADQVGISSSSVHIAGIY